MNKTLSVRIEFAFLWIFCRPPFPCSVNPVISLWGGTVQVLVLEFPATTSPRFRLNPACDKAPRLVLPFPETLKTLAAEHPSIHRQVSNPTFEFSLDRTAERLVIGIGRFWMPFCALYWMLWQFSTEFLDHQPRRQGPFT
jgi:hypothetical protein